MRVTIFSTGNSAIYCGLRRIFYVVNASYSSRPFKLRLENRMKQLRHIPNYGTEPVPTVLYLHDWHDIVANTALCVELL